VLAGWRASATCCRAGAWEPVVAVEARDPPLCGSLGSMRDRRDPVRVFEFMTAHQPVFPVAATACVPGVSESGYQPGGVGAVCPHHHRCSAAERFMQAHARRTALRARLPNSGQEDRSSGPSGLHG
jgi:hypothetical protein